jgi:hypothetical protein
MKMVHGFLKLHFCLTVPHYRTWKSLAEVESSSIPENHEERKRQKGPFLLFENYINIFYRKLTL